MVKNVMFDIDGTLWNSTEVVAKGWRQAVEETGYSKVNVTGEILKKEFGLPMNIIADHVFTDLSDQAKKDEILELACKYEHVCLEENEVDISYPGIVSTIRNLSKDKNVYIVSNCQKGYIELVTDKLGITDCISDYLCFGDTGLTKGETMSMLMEKNGLVKDESVYVGDIIGDKNAADYAGVRFVWAEYGFGNPADFVNSEYKISTPDELTRLIDEM